jgi:hypothetical protein
MKGAIGAWQKPPDVPALVCAVAGFVFLVCSLSPRATSAILDRILPSRGKTPWELALASSLLSLGYIAWYLRGGPRIIDATTYWLEGRSIAHGGFGFDIPDPSASFRGRFLLHHDDRLAGIFPPGYPLLLAAGFLIGAPLVIGPLLAGAIALTTAALARQLGASENVARFAALLSLLCAALRYHTADTMSHGAAALGIALAVLFSLRARKRDAVFAGLALGWVLSTRIPSVLGVGAVAAFLTWRSKRVQWLALGALPGVALLLLSQKAVTGHFFAFAQSEYYRVSDGPPGCFRYGFGSGIGCVYEHGDVVTTRLSHGYGALEAIVTNAHRLWQHADDILDGWPLALFLLPAVVRTARTSLAGKALGAIVVLQVLAYAPFYFDGNYPGGGARHLADILPLEHALIAVAVSGMAIATFEQRALAIAGAAALLFGIHTAHAHVQLQKRDGGKPMFEPDELQKAGAGHGLVFVDTDHGFALAHDPGAKPESGFVAARWRDDAHDRLLFDRLGHPASYVYRFEKTPPVSSWSPPPAADEAGRETWRFESESDWPPLEQSAGYAKPTWASSTCASNGRVLELVPSEAGARAVIALPVPRSERWRIVPRLIRRPKDGGGTVTIGDAHWSVEPVEASEITCIELAPVDLQLQEGEIPVILQAYGGPLALDRIVLGRPPL